MLKLPKDAAGMSQKQFPSMCKRQTPAASIEELCVELLLKGFQSPAGCSRRERRSAGASCQVPALNQVQEKP
ncbi:hypothetical protein AVS7_01449 [Acidovorax sp. MR-S7]|nr:hypothetical protein AVS7_01449 [Acidovorax sp. MR-S7]